MGSATEDRIVSRELQGRAELRRVGRVRFPVFELVHEGAVVASMGRAGWVRLFFGRGQRIELADGSRWRLTALGVAGAICPAILDDGKHKIALSSLAEGGYGIQGMAYGFTLHRAEKRRFSRANRWIMRHYEDEIATVTRYPPTIDAFVPMHVGAVLVAFTLTRYGILGESNPRFKFRWG